MIAKVEEVIGTQVLDREGNPIVESKSYKQIVQEIRNFDYTQFLSLPIPPHTMALETPLRSLTS